VCALPRRAKGTGACLFCRIAGGSERAHLIFDDDVSLAFLDHRPLIHGHVLLVPREHVATLVDLPDALLPRFFTNVRRLARAVEEGMGAEGTFVAINNRVSQAVPHVHVHVVPRRKGDGLKGFFWPRYKYESEAQMVEVAERIRACFQRAPT
jgi:histidine triad (HIT) family protein